MLVSIILRSYCSTVEIVGVDGSLLRPDGGAGVIGSLGEKDAASKEIDEDWKGRVQEFF